MLEAVGEPEDREELSTDDSSMLHELMRTDVSDIPSRRCLVGESDKLHSPNFLPRTAADVEAGRYDAH
jgi:hypothetical protein